MAPVTAISALHFARRDPDKAAARLDRARRRKAGVPDEIEFKTKPEIALEQLRFACAAGLPRGVVLLDAGYGNNSALRAEITALGLAYAAGILSTTTVWPPDDRHHAPAPRRRPRQNAAAMPMLRSAYRQTITTQKSHLARGRLRAAFFA